MNFSNQLQNSNIILVLNCLWDLKLNLQSIKLLTFNIYNNICYDPFMGFKINKPIKKSKRDLVSIKEIKYFGFKYCCFISMTYDVSRIGQNGLL